LFYAGLLTLPYHEKYNYIGIIIIKLATVIDGILYAGFIMILTYLVFKALKPAYINGQLTKSFIKKYLRYLPWSIWIKVLIIIFGVIMTLLVQIKFTDLPLWSHGSGLVCFLIEFLIYIKFVFLPHEIILKENFHINPYKQTKRLIKREKRFLTWLIMLPFIFEKIIVILLPI